MKLSWQVFAVAGAGAGAWVFARMRTQRKLAELLSASPVVFAAMSDGYVTWLPEEKAKKVARFDNAISAQAGFAQVMAEIRAVMPPEAELQIGADVQRAVEGQLLEMGMTEKQIEDAKSEAAGLYQSLPDVPMIDTSKWLPTWITGAE